MLGTTSNWRCIFYDQIIDTKNKRQIKSTKPFRFEVQNRTVQFYEQFLQFKILSADKNCVSFNIGESVLEFTKDDKENNHYYHIAFNIHSNLFKMAKEWLSKRIELLKEDGYFQQKVQ
ncbi:hypothetical protein BIV60_19700 [Bacillus sp. MUM 116]|nr:hypothetical protein BIV60_19700 [Bacillus sp. MUM 116]